MSGYKPHPEYINYNEVIIEIDGYRVSNINTSGRPSDNCGAHLLSFTINSAAYESDSVSSIGCKGSLSLIDYKYSVFNTLVNHWIKNNQSSNNKVTNNVNVSSSNDNNIVKSEGIFPYIKVTLKCFTGKRDWSGVITKWEMSFSGGAPRIDIDWGVYSQTNQNAPEIKPASFKKPENMLKYIQDTLGNSVSFVFKHKNQKYVNADIANHLKFNKDEVRLDVSKFNSNLDILLAAYLFMCENLLTIDGDKPLYPTMDIGDEFVCRSLDPNDNTEKNDETEPINNLIFIQNSSYAPYSLVSCGEKPKSNRYVIPTMSLNFKTDFSKIPIQPTIINNINGATKISNNGCSSTNNAIATEKKIECDSKSTNQGQIEISFDCYNVACFSNNNVALQPLIKVFDEFGNEVNFLSTSATVTNVIYSLEGAVIKASVKCTTVFGNNKPNEIVETGLIVSEDADVKPESENKPENESKPEEPSDLKKYLCSEDVKPIYLSNDKTKQCIDNNKFVEHVDKFLNEYGNLLGTSKLIDYSFINELISDGNFGLLTLLIAVGNYGIKNYPDYWGKGSYIDAVSMYKSFKPFCASATGKSPFDYAKGGLGIAHWDSGNLKDIYQNIGFDTNTNKAHFEDLLCSEGRIIEWENISFNGIARIAPKFSKGAVMRVFDRGLKQDSEWKEWAKSILYFVDSNGKYVYQRYLFKLWVDKFWYPTMSALKKAKPSAKHVICLQDTVRISRAGNSLTKLINESAGKSVKEQYVLYYDDIDRYVIQKAFCRRCADIISWEIP